MKKKKSPAPMTRAEISAGLSGLSVAQMLALSAATGVSPSTLYRMREPGWNVTMAKFEAVAAELQKKSSATDG